MALWNLDFAIAKGQLVGIIGPNGAGKSTLLKTLVGIIRPISGRVLLFGKSLNKVRSKVAYVPQRSCVDWDFPITVFDLLLMGRYRQMGRMKWASKADKLAALAELERLEMTPFAHCQIGQLSGGQQQRLFIGRALLQNADLYLLDEPFSGIDLSTEKMLMKLFQEMRGQGKTVIIVHHGLHAVEAYFNHLLLLNTSLIASGPVAQVMSAKNLDKAYGTKGAFLEELSKISSKKTYGIS